MPYTAHHIVKEFFGSESSAVVLEVFMWHDLVPLIAKTVSDKVVSQKLAIKV